MRLFLSIIIVAAIAAVTSVSCEGVNDGPVPDGSDTVAVDKPDRPGGDTTGTDEPDLPDNPDDTTDIEEPPVTGDTVALDIEVPSPDWSASFDRRSLFIRFTGTWCSWCPWMDWALQDAHEQRPDDLVPVSSYDELSEGGLAWNGDKELEKYYGIDSHPVGIFNNMARFGTQAQEKTTAQVVALCDEARTMLPARTAIYADAVLNDGRLSTQLYVAVREAGEYSLTVWLVEDGIHWEQRGSGGGDYVHDWVIRSSLTAVLGDKLLTDSGSASIPAQTVCGAFYSIDLPESVLVEENAYLVAFVTRPGGYQSGNVSGVLYSDCGPLVDNALAFPIAM